AECSQHGGREVSLVAGKSLEDETSQARRCHVGLPSRQCCARPPKHLYTLSIVKLPDAIAQPYGSALRAQPCELSLASSALRAQPCELSLASSALRAQCTGQVSPVTSRMS